ncbi:hypothetical protein Dsin_030456 [Dipteronia sinensis]|uniref:Uncharacterized protein n=1 Tax=Dipteronia sinensis TaxID=43782 RepID=A0AAE0DSG0_9ROSI|nr:hypothetical protein Dsin_030456 [Dipteronia sinensis]
MASSGWKMPRRAVELLDCKDKSIRLSEKVSVEKLLLKVGHNVAESQTRIAEMHRGRPRANKTDCNCDANTTPKQKRSRSDTATKASSGQKMPRQAATCSDFKEKSICLSEKAFVVENKRDAVVEEEIAARD